jgi:hypothetical protein
MFNKKLKLGFIALIFMMSSQPIRSNDYNARDYLEMGVLAADIVKSIAISMHLLKDMTRNDIDHVLHNINNITWDLVLPIIAGCCVAAKCHTGNNNAMIITTGAASGIGAGLIAYTIGSIPKEIINKLISKATGIKYTIEEAMA